MTRASVPLLVGAAFGVVVVALNHAEASFLRALSLVTGGGAAWATFAVLMSAWWRRGPLQSVVAGTAALAAAVAAYYVADAVAADSPIVHDLADIRFWVVAALVVGPPLGLVGWRARRDHTWAGLTAMLIVPLGFAGESAIYLDGYAWLSPLERATRLTIVGGALTVAAVLVWEQLVRGAERRPGARRPGATGPRADSLRP